MVVKTRFMTVRAEDVSGVGRGENGDMFIIFKSGATHHVKYNSIKECDSDHLRLSAALEGTGLKKV